ncbi:MAG: EcoKI restriction-modification system protein HsdS [bacterium ADurb.Bin429]|nr:MAG: EcoKI restriction-modification system protein HsdS [bacterium ADurb.Bin429]
MAPSHWNNMRLVDFVTLHRGYELSEPKRNPGSVPVMGSFGVTGFHDTAIVKGPGVIVGRSGASFGQVKYCASDFWPLNTALYVMDFHGNDEKFAYYFLTWMDFSAYNSGSAQPMLNRNYIHPIQITVPPIHEQRAIAHILGSLDDKIELNRRMNATLEAMARALFRSWFVDFDPVRAKAAGKQPDGMDTTTAALFPDSFEDSALGRVPKGWKVSTIGDEVRVVGGSTPSTAEPAYWEDGTINWATPKDLSTLSSPVLLHTERQITEAGLAKISSGLLPHGTVLLSSRAPIGYIALAEKPIAINQGFIAMVCDGSLPNLYVLYWTREHMEIIIGRANGTTFLEVSKANFRPIPMLVPSPKVLNAFMSIVELLFQRLTVNLVESAQLAVMRDSLLPKLLSGEIRPLKVME